MQASKWLAFQTSLQKPVTNIKSQWKKDKEGKEMSNQIITEADIKKAADEMFGVTPIPTVGSEPQKMPAKKDPISSFSGPGGAFRCNVEMLSYWDKSTKEYGPYQASISLRHNNKFGSLPVDPTVLKEFAGWLIKVSDILVGIPSRDIAQMDDDFKAADARIAKYRVKG